MKILRRCADCTGVTKMLFHEIHGSYFSAVSAILKEAVNGTLTKEKIAEIVREKAFVESILTIPDALKSQEWLLLTDDLQTPLKHAPSTPLTILEKRWLKAVLEDPRVKLFAQEFEGLEDVSPLYRQEQIVYFDRYSDGDPYDDPEYRSHFQLILRALREKRCIRIRFEGGSGKRHSWKGIPHKLEYSEKDDKFRLLMASARGEYQIINLARVSSVQIMEEAFEDRPEPQYHTAELTFELTDERNALERVLLHFSHLKKETVKLDEKHYRVRI
ncbi:MAG: WYL domain-containing protein, partial [Christensenellaceae bacterium]|nr:WYL domain-containing protein [Christensenellaceae bacterium]